MKTAAITTVLLTALSLGACDKSDKKSETKDPAAEKAADPAAAGTTPGTAADPAAAGTGPGTAADPAAGTPAAGTPAAGTPAAGGDGKIEILAEGSEPRHLLQYKPKAGAKQGMTMTMDIAIDSPQTGKMPMPQMTMKATSEVLSVGENGNITAKMTIDGLTMKGAGAVPGLDAVKGMAMTMTIEPSGKFVDMKFDEAKDPMAAQMMGQTQQSFDKMVAQFPEVPVGKGAKWKVVQQIEQQGMKIGQEVVYELVDVTATTATIKGVMSMSAPPQEIEQQGMKMKLDKFDGTGTLDLKVDFTEMVPVADVSMDAKMKMAVMGQTADMSVKTDMNIKPSK